MVFYGCRRRQWRHTIAEFFWSGRYLGGKERMWGLLGSTTLLNAWGAPAALATILLWLFLLIPGCYPPYLDKTRYRFLSRIGILYLGSFCSFLDCWLGNIHTNRVAVAPLTTGPCHRGQGFGSTHLFRALNKKQTACITRWVDEYAIGVWSLHRGCNIIDKWTYYY